MTRTQANVTTSLVGDVTGGFSAKRQKRMFHPLLLQGDPVVWICLVGIEINTMIVMVLSENIRENLTKTNVRLNSFIKNCI